ncbi:NAD(P)/FAD-dependent oxidoreductase [Patescibacteria group bacterium]
MEKRNIVIIGGGPGGLMAAFELARAGRDVLLLEKHAEFGHKVCAEAITAKTLDKFPFAFPCIEKSFRRLKLNYYGKTTYFGRKAPVIHMINRRLLGEIQKELAEAAGAEIRLGTNVRRISDQAIETTTGEKISYDYLIGADGNKSIVRKFLKIPTKLYGVGIQYRLPGKRRELEIHLDTSKWDFHYAWVFPHKNYTSIGTGYPIHKSAKPFVENLKQLCRQSGFKPETANLESDMINADFRGYQFGNKYLVGESSGLISSLTGEGIYNALIMGSEVAKQIITGQKSSPVIQSRLETKCKHERFIRLYNRCPWLVSLGYRSMPILKKFK